MRLVREHINEKFTEDSDPIKDMGIGFDGIFSTEKDYSRYTVSPENPSLLLL
jgi:hypothetical protein